MGGFFTSLQYGVMFPLAGFNYLPGELARSSAQQGGVTTDKLGLDTRRRRCCAGTSAFSSRARRLASPPLELDSSRYRAEARAIESSYFGMM